MEYLNFAVIQSGYCVFGAGETADAALQDAASHLEPRKLDDEAYTSEMVGDECDEFEFDGDLDLIERADDPDEFDSYMRSQGGFTFDGSGWTR